MKPALRICNLSKRYRLGVTHANSLRDLAAGFVSKLAGRWQSRPAKRDEAGLAHKDRFENNHVWALDDISFDVGCGEVIGIIGRNGAGKSTLLKVLSRVTAPTSGYAEIYGRVASLLEVGTGFHPELSGRENISLNGAILGMSRREIRAKFDEIVDFAGVEEFLDTPVKRYSSGMHLRLAFSVAAHLDPEILIIDEVLAVGDIAFQKKCVGKMSEVARQNRTVLFVSHNLGAVRSLCQRGIVIDQGRLVMDAPIGVATEHYVKSFDRERSLAAEGLKNRLDRTSGDVRFTEFTVTDEDGNQKWEFDAGEPLYLRLSYQALADVSSLGLYLALNSGNNSEVVTTIREILAPGRVASGQTGEITVSLADNLLRPGDYSFYVCLGDAQCDLFYDVIDANVSLPCLSIKGSEDDPRKNDGYFSIPFHIEHRT